MLLTGLAAALRCSLVRKQDAVFFMLFSGFGACSR